MNETHKQQRTFASWKIVILLGGMILAIFSITFYGIRGDVIFSSSDSNRSRKNNNNHRSLLMEFLRLPDPKSMKQKPMKRVIKKRGHEKWVLAQYIHPEALDRASPILSQNYHYALIHDYGYELCVANEFDDCQVLYDKIDDDDYTYYLLDGAKFIGKQHLLEKFNKSILTDHPDQWYPTTPYELAIFPMGPDCLQHANAVSKLKSVLIFYANPSIQIMGKERGPSYPFITGDGFRNFCGTKYRCTSSDRGCNFHALDITDPHQCVYLELSHDNAHEPTTRYAEVFIDEILPALQYPVTLVSGGSSKLDVPVVDYLSLLLEKDNVKHYFTSQCDWGFGAKPEKLTCLPRGIDNRYVKGYGHDFVRYLEYMEEPPILKDANRPLLVLDPDAADYFSNKDYAVIGYSIPDDPNVEIQKQDKVAELDQYPFIYPTIQEETSKGDVPTPHPTVMELLFRCKFPLVQISKLDVKYKGLPVLIVNDLDEISNDLLATAYHEFLHSLHWRMDRLFFSYWEALILRKMIE